MSKARKIIVWVTPRLISITTGRSHMVRTADCTNGSSTSFNCYDGTSTSESCSVGSYTMYCTGSGNAPNACGTGTSGA
jgi:hypothetical protein